MPDSPFRIFPPLSGRFASSSLPPIPSPFFLPFFLSFFIQFLPPFLSSSLFSFLPLFFLPPTPTLRHFSFRIYPATPLAYFTAAALPSSFSSAAAPNTFPKPGRPVPHTGRKNTLATPRLPPAFPASPPPQPSPTQLTTTHKTRDPSFTVRVPPPLNNQTIMKLKSFPLSPKAVGYTATESVRCPQRAGRSVPRPATQAASRSNATRRTYPTLSPVCDGLVSVPPTGSLLYKYTQKIIFTK